MIGIGEYTPAVGGYIVEVYGIGQVVVSHNDFCDYLGKRIIEQVELFRKNNPDCKTFSIGVCVLKEK